MNIKTKVILTVIACIFLGSLAILFFSDNQYEHNKARIGEDFMKTAKATFDGNVNNDVKMLTATMNAVLENKQVMDAFAKKDRDKLLKLTQPLYKINKKAVKITNWNFMEPESNKTFLRVHQNPKSFGDVLTRPLFLKTVASKDYTSGFELAKAGFALRLGHPCYDEQGKLTGYTELGETVDHIFQNIKAQTGDDVGLIVKKKFMKKEAWDATIQGKGTRNNWDDFKDTLVIDRTIDDNDLIAYDGDLEQIPDQGILLGEVKKNDSVYLKGLFPIVDANNAKIGGVFVLHNITPVYNDMKSLRTNTIIFVILQALVICGLIIVMLGSLIFVRLQKIIDTATVVVGGDYDKSIAVTKNDELGMFELLFEQFRQVFVNTLNELQDLKKQIK